MIVIAAAGQTQIAIIKAIFDELSETLVLLLEPLGWLSVLLLFLLLVWLPAVLFEFEELLPV